MPFAPFPVSFGIIGVTTCSGNERGYFFIKGLACFIVHVIHKREDNFAVGLNWIDMVSGMFRSNRQKHSDQATSSAFNISSGCARTSPSVGGLSARKTLDHALLDSENQPPSSYGKRYFSTRRSWISRTFEACEIVRRIPGHSLR